VLHRLGFRFRLHRKDLPGTPDIVLPRHKKLIFVHGCFWHGHHGCPRAKLPQTNTSFWAPKIRGNIARDVRTVAALRRAGWKILTIWQCETKNAEYIASRIHKFLAATK
jgi:DNA mismatch endonuclease (patch repair protein)